MEEKKILDNISAVSDLVRLSDDDLRALCGEIRADIISTVEKNGGHLSSALGAVEAIVALCSVYDFSVDKIFFDVGHQSYAFKLLTVGRECFSKMRTEGGPSGFCGDDKTAADGFIGGHAGNSLAAACGYAFARDLKGGDECVVVFVGDASLFNGENLEALFAEAKKPQNFLVVFNDNGMSISENRNGAYRFFSKLALRKSYGRTKKFLHKILGNRLIARSLKRLKSNFKHSVSPATVLDQVGLKYFGVFDGHDIKGLRSALGEIRARKKPAFLHIRTQKGKGHSQAENDPECYHGIGKGLTTSQNDFSAVVSDYLTELAETDEKLVALTAGMKTGTGLAEFAKAYPERFVDAGICEEYAVTCAAGMAYNGLHPVACIYSTFMQRAFDQLVTDVCMQGLAVTFLLDRAGFVGSDGKTHNGVMDLSYLRSVPGLTVLAPKDVAEFKRMLFYAVGCGSPVAIRYSNGKNPTFSSEALAKDFTRPGEWEILKSGDRAVVFAVGPRCLRLALAAAESFSDSVAVVNARSIKPLDEQTLLAFKHLPAVVLEENVACGGFGEGVCAYYASLGKPCPTVVLGSGDRYLSHASVEGQLSSCGLTKDGLTETLAKLLSIDN